MVIWNMKRLQRKMTFKHGSHTEPEEKQYCVFHEIMKMSLIKRHLNTRHSPVPGKLIYSPVVNWATERVWKVVWRSALVISHCHWTVPLVVSFF